MGILLALVLGVGGLAGCQSGKRNAEPSPAHTTTRPSPADGIPTTPGTHRLTLNMGGLVPRSYLLHMPSRWPSAKLPLVLAMHGGFDSPNAMEARSGLDPLADKKGFIVAYPEGTATTWNAGGCCGIAKMIHADDLGFLTKLIDKLDGTGFVDAKRVYATGFSNGAGMSYELACHAPDKVAAVGVVEAALAIDCKPDHKVSVIIFHGTKDANVPFNGGGHRDVDDPRPFPPVSFAVNFWRKAEGLPTLTDSKALTKTADSSATQCQSADRDGVGVAFCKINGGTHTWPAYAAALQWNFFAAHPQI